MIRRPPRSTRTDTLFPYTTLFRSESLRRNLPSKPIAVLEPAAGGFGAALGEPAPERVDLFLRVAFDQERDGFVEGIVRAAVQRKERLSGELEGHQHDRSLLVGIGCGVASDIHDAADWKSIRLHSSHYCDYGMTS